MTSVMVPIKALDEKCVSCKAMNIVKVGELYGDGDVVATEYSCSNLHLCTYIKNRIVRNEAKEKENADSD